MTQKRSRLLKMTARWGLKRGLKWAVQWSTELSGLGYLYRRTRAYRQGFRILTYHGIADSPKDSYSVRTDHFRDHMAFLADNHRLVDLGAAARGLSSGRADFAQAVAVTFDDGYRDAAGVVREILERHKIPATFYVITGILDRKGANVGGPYLSWDEVRELAAAGFAIGSHTVTHHSLGMLGPEDVRRELSDSRERISQEVGRAPRGVSFPYGTVRDFSAESARMAKEVGYEYAVTAVHGLNLPGCDLFSLRRTTIGAGDGLRTFRMIMKGDLDPWVLVDRWGYRFQRTFDAGPGKIP